MIRGDLILLLSGILHGPVLERCSTENHTWLELGDTPSQEFSHGDPGDLTKASLIGRLAGRVLWVMHAGICSHTGKNGWVVLNLS